MHHRITGPAAAAVVVALFVALNVALVPVGLQRPGTRLSIPTAAPALQLASNPSRAAPVEASRADLHAVHIPATRSRFVARDALIDLPPAARTDPFARFPVIIALGGQPGKPADLVQRAHLPQVLDRIAAAHHGVAPILVMPDQLGPAEGDPMCVDSPLGRVDAYLTQDVRRWVLRHLPVLTSRRDWTIAGFSEGGTCAITLAARHRGLFGSVIDVSGESAPRNGTLQHTLAVAFHGSRAAYEAVTPLHLLATRSRRPAVRAFFAVGQDDARYGPVEPVVAAAARRAGMRTSFHVVPGGGHTWKTAAAGYEWALTGLVDWLDAPTGRCG